MSDLLLVVVRETKGYAKDCTVLNDTGRDGIGIGIGSDRIGAWLGFLWIETESMAL